MGSMRNTVTNGNSMPGGRVFTFFYPAPINARSRISFRGYFQAARGFLSSYIRAVFKGQLSIEEHSVFVTCLSFRIEGFRQQTII